MLTIETVDRDFAALPWVTRIGLVVLLLGGVMDIVAHLETIGHGSHLHEHTSAEVTAHAVAFVGMVLVLLGVVVDGVRRSRLGRVAEPRS